MIIIHSFNCTHWNH